MDIEQETLDTSFQILYFYLLPGLNVNLLYQWRENAWDMKNLGAEQYLKCISLMF